MTAEAWVGLGANLGDTAATLDAALRALATLPQTRLLAASPRYRSAPVDASGPDFLNAVARLETDLTPEQVLTALQAIELDHGRERPYRHAPRTLDLDLLLHGETVCSSPFLTLPHPRLHQRAFVLRPLLDLAPTLTAPGLGRLADHWPGVAGQSLQPCP